MPSRLYYLKLITLHVVRLPQDCQPFASYKHLPRFSSLLLLQFRFRLLNQLPQLLGLALRITLHLLTLLEQFLLAAPLVVLQIAIALCQLRALVDEVACEEEVIGGADGEGVAHEGRGVDNESGCHFARDAN